MPPLRCIKCGTACGPDGCGRCGFRYETRNGLLFAHDQLTGNNRVAAEFYDSDRWQRFKFWERLFLRLTGGLRGARLQILRHLSGHLPGSLLEVGIGGGDNVPLLPVGTRVTGIDVARRPLTECRERYPNDGMVLAVAEAENIPFADAAFDAVLCVGGFNFFGDPVRSLKEMARVARPGGRIVVADERPDLLQYGLGHLLDWPDLDRWLMERYWFGPEFTAVVLGSRLDVAASARAALRRWRLRKIWRGYGWCLIADV